MEYATIEHAVRAAWQDTLQTEVGPADNFFQLGGDSLGALRTLTRLKRDLAWRVPLKTLFQNPRFEDFVQALADEHAPVPVDDDSAGRVVPQPSILQIERLRYYDERGATQEGMTTTVRLRGPLRPELLRQALLTVTGRHDGLRMLFRTSASPRQFTGSPDERAVVTVSLAEPEQALSFEVASLIGADQSEVDARIDAHAGTPHDLVGGPRLRALLLELDAEDWLFVLTVDHMVYDLESHAVFLQEVAEVHDAATAGIAPRLPPAPSYAEWVDRQWAFLDGPEGRRRLKVWADRYARDGVFPPAALPALGGEHGGRAAPAHVVIRELPGEWLTTLLRKTSEHHTTAFNVLLAAYTAARARLTGESRLGTVVALADRDDPSTERLVGLLAPAIPIWADLDDATSFPEVVRRVTAATVAAIDDSLPMLTGAHALLSGMFGQPPPERVRELSGLWGTATFELRIDGPDPAPLLTLSGIESSPYDRGIQPFEMVMGGVMLYANLSPERNLVALMYPEGGYDEKIMTELIDDVIRTVEE
ncbi:condensation domain-containing protein [Plantactinospora sp. CA-290183]|uniref:condensation domain-containing protein n=1 Tax=Plantactinospora sp. CA-290183 TaxID=3240006 RepID=UPI003D8C6C1F